MEIRNGKIVVGAAGGTAGKNAKTYKVSLFANPTFSGLLRHSPNPRILITERFCGYAPYRRLMTHITKR